MKRFGIMIATAALSMTATVSAFAYRGYSNTYAADQNINACYDYVCDYNGEYCADYYEPCYDGSNGRIVACPGGSYRGCAGNGYCSNRGYISCR
ncbi:MAG: hypothetical protein J6M92_02355 [Oribacterium sp.]|nr:hypothetical protein [Oribacterium sp.]